MKTVIMPVAIIKNGDSILLRKMNPERNPYREPWAIFGGRIEGDDSVQDALNRELLARWGFKVRIEERLWWDEEIKTDHDGETKRFIYLDVICAVDEGTPSPGHGEELKWVTAEQLSNYAINPPTKVVLDRLFSKE